jgi:hypothetical protein
VDDNITGYSPNPAFRILSDGTSHLVFSPLDFLARLASIIPVPRKNLIRYTGVLGARSKLRSSIVPKPKPSHNQKLPLKRPARLKWHELLKRTFRINVLKCFCGGLLELAATITDPRQIRRYLIGIGEEPIPPPISPAKEITLDLFS